jgi:hypothetical protein
VTERWAGCSVTGISLLSRRKTSVTESLTGWLVDEWAWLAYSQSIRQGGGLSEGDCQLNKLSDRQVERLSYRQVKTLTDTQVAKLAVVSRQVYCTRLHVWG